MPEVIRNRFRDPQAQREPDVQEAPRTRPGFGPDEDPLAELARIVGDTAPVARPPVAPPQAARTEAPSMSAQPAPHIRPAAVSQASPTSATPPRDYPRRDTSWRDPQARTIVRASLTPQTMPGQLHDLEADLLNEIRSENIRTLPPAPDLADLGLPDARLPQYPANGSGSTPPTRQATQSRAGVAPPMGGSAGRLRADLDDEVTLPMQAQLRATPPSARAPEDLRMHQLPRYAPASPAPDVDHAAGYDAYGYPVQHGAPEDYDPAGALGEGYYEEAEAEYTPGHPETHAVEHGHPSVAHEGDYPPISAHYADEADDRYGSREAYDDDLGGYADAATQSRRRPKPARSNVLMLGMVAVVCVVVLGVGGMFTWRAIASSGLTGTNAPLIKADTRPMKEMVAQAPLGAPGPNLDATRSDSQDKLVTQTEDPVDQIPGKPPVRVVGAASAQDPTLPVTRRVRSVIVRPDGTIVSPEDAAKPAPAASPTQTASLPQAATTPPAPAPQLPAQPAPAPQAATPPASSAVLAPITGVTHIDNVPVVTKPNPAPPVAARPAPPPAAQAQPVVKPAKPATAAVQPTLAPHAPASGGNAPLALGPSSGSAPVRVASAPTPPAAQAPRAPSGDAGTSEYMVQISSHTSDAEARHALASAEQKYASLGIRGGDVQQADLGARGTYYRARIGGGSHEQALALCQRIKSQGGDCVVVKR